MPRIWLSVVKIYGIYVASPSKEGHFIKVSKLVHKFVRIIQSYFLYNKGIKKEVLII